MAYSTLLSKPLNSPGRTVRYLLKFEVPQARLAIEKLGSIDRNSLSIKYLVRGEMVYGESMVKLLVRDRETIQEAVRRFRKLVERSGIKKEMRRREFYEKPSEIKRRNRLRAERRARRTSLLSNS